MGRGDGDEPGTYARHASVLALNGGSSSIRFALHQVSPPHRRLLHGKVDRIGRSSRAIASAPGAPERGGRGGVHQNTPVASDSPAAT